MKRSYRVGIFASAVIAITWMLLGLVWAYFSNWDYANIAPNAEYWGNVIQSACAVVGTSLLLVTLGMQRDELAEQRIQLAETAKETARSHRIGEQQRDALRQQAETAQVSAEFDKLVPILKLRNELTELYYRIDTKPQADLFKDQIKRLDDVLKTLVGRSHVDDETRQLLYRMCGTVNIDDRKIENSF